MIRVVLWCATTRAVHLECVTPLLLEEVALAGQQVQFLENIEINGCLD